MAGPKPKFEIVAGIIRSGDEVLIARRKRGQHLPGLWEFPGGKLESDESHADCLERECREELGIKVEPSRLLETTEHEYPERSVVLHFYECRWIAGEPRPLSADKVRWVRLADLKNYEFLEANAGILGLLDEE